MWILVAGLVVFFGIHLTRVIAPGLRERQVAAGEQRWKGIYSLIALAGVGLMVWGWIVYRGEAPQVFDPPAWGRHVAMALMLPALILVAAANMPAGRIKAAVKHPFLLGIILWAGAHLLANGDLASLLLFGSFLAYAVLDRIAVIPRGDPAPLAVRPRSDLVASVAGVVLYAVLVLFLHQWLFGVSPLG